MRLSTEGAGRAAVPDGIDGAGLAAALTTSVVWGLTGVFVRLLPDVSPLFITGLRLLVAAAAALPFALALRAPRIRLFAAARTARAWWLGLHLVLYYGTAVAAYQLAPVAEVALFLSTSPLVALGIAALRREPVRRAEVVGAVVALAGVAVVVLPGILSGGSAASRLAGHGLSAASATSAAVYADAYRRYGLAGRAPDGLSVTLLASFVGGVVLVSATHAAGASSAVVFEGGALGYLLALGLVSTLLPSVLTAVASQRLPAVVTTTVRLLIPVFAAAFALLVLGERPTLWTIPGGLLVLGGIGIMVRRG